MSEGVATLAPSGAGRLEDWIFPGRLTAAGGAGFDPSCTTRNGSLSQIGTVTIIGAGANPVADVRLGVPCVNFACSGAGSVGFRFYPPMSMLFRTSKTPITPQADDQQVTRLIWIFCGSGLAPNAGLDMGLEIVRVQGATGRILVDVQDGFGFRLADANVLQWIVRGPNGLITLPITAAPFSLAVWHSIDLRLTSATATADATLELRLDDTVVDLGVLNSSWAAGTNLPPAAALLGSVGFMPCLFSNAGNANQFWTYQLRYITAPNILATL